MEECIHFYIKRDNWNNIFRCSPVAFQSKAQPKGSRMETPQGIQGTAAEGCTPAACTQQSHTELVVEPADYTH